MVDANKYIVNKINTKYIQRHVVIRTRGFTTCGEINLTYSTNTVKVGILSVLLTSLF